MYCLKCGSHLPDDAGFCSKCGAKILAPSNAESLKCPSCGAPIAPKFGEMIITCEYCGTSITLGTAGWANIQKQTTLPLTIQSTDEISNRVKSMMDRGMLHRHLQESSTLEEMTLSVVPYWLVSVSARTSIIATNMVAEGATVATTAALIGVMAGMGGGRRGGFGAPLLGGDAGFNDGQRHWRRGWTEEWRFRWIRTTTFPSSLSKLSHSINPATTNSRSRVGLCSPSLSTLKGSRW